MAWLEVALLDETGTPLLVSGFMDAQRFVDPESHFYRGVFVGEAGQELTKRNGWDRRAPIYVRAIPPGSADTVHVRFRVPESAEGPLRLRARLVYRKHKQSYNRWAMGAVPAAEQPDGAVVTPAVDTRVWDYDDSLVPDLPAVILHETELELPLAGAESLVDGAAPEADVLITTPGHWMRFNDWGIGLLRQGDLRGAVRAFRLVQQMRPDYADGFVNEARAHLQGGNLGEAEQVLESAFALEPGYFKAAYFAAQAARGFGEYERAAELLEGVIDQFPYDRVVRLDLGNTYYLMGRHAEAIEQLLFVIDNIDPEELGAHYNLMLAYRAQGLEDRAEIHESRYLRYREDEDIRQITGPYKRANEADNREAQPIHLHRLQPTGLRYSAPERFPWTDWLEGGPRYREPLYYPGPTPPSLRADRPVDRVGGR